MDEEQLKNFQAYYKAEGFRQFQRETADRLHGLMGQGYTRQEAIELLKLYALQGIAYNLSDQS